MAAEVNGWNPLRIMIYQLTLTVATAMEETSVTRLNEEDRLLRDLFKTGYYNPVVRPVLNISRVVNLTIDIALNQILDFDEPRMELSSEIWMRVYWRDVFLTWNASEYSGLTAIRLPAKDVWLPDVMLYSSVVIPPDGVFGNRNILVTLSSNGDISWLFPSVTHSRCNVDMRLFPFDIQRCELEFGSWTYTGVALDFYPRNPFGDRSNFIDNGEWELIDLPSYRKELIYNCCPDPYPSVVYTFVLRRRPMYYFFNMALPCFLITLVNLFSFLLPVETGEKITFNITTLLALVVFLRLVAENIPPQAEVFPVIQLYFALCILILCMSTVVGVFVYRIHFAGESRKPFPVWARKIMYGPIGRVLCACPSARQEQESKILTVIAADDRKLTGSVPSRIGHLSIHQPPHPVNQDGKTDTDTIPKDFREELRADYFETAKEDWRHFAKFFDKLFFCVFVVVLFSVSLYMLMFLRN